MFETRFRSIVDSAADGIILMDGAGAVTMFNPACERMFGYAAAEVLGGDVDLLMPAPDDAEPGPRVAIDQQPGRRKVFDVGGEVLGRRKNGEAFLLDLSVGEAERNGEVCYVGIVRDVTERKRAGETRELWIEQLTVSSDERAYFVQVASHDLREPLRMVANFCGLLSKNYGDRLDDRGREYVALAVAATRQMQDLIDDLVDFGRLGLEAESGSWFGADEVLDQVVEILQAPIEESGAEISRDPLPRVFGNPYRLQRLLQNLIGNALKYVDPGVGPRVHVSAEADGDFWRFSVSDNGIGIEPRHFGRIFEPFKRLHARNEYYGSGLGLAICRKIVEGFGGRIWVCSTPGLGSTFSFTVKIQHEEEPASVHPGP